MSVAKSNLHVRVCTSGAGLAIDIYNSQFHLLEFSIPQYKVQFIIRVTRIVPSNSIVARSALMAALRESQFVQWAG
jgi:hypothetical protein